MSTLGVVFIGISILLFLLSFFQKDSTKQLEEEVEQLSMNMLQEQYSIKKRIQILEEELLISNGLSNLKVEKKIKPNKILINQVISLANQGLPISQIAKQSSLPVDTIEEIISGRMK